jgi:hypothetical protein
MEVAIEGDLELKTNVRKGYWAVSLSTGMSEIIQ